MAVIHPDSVRKKTPVFKSVRPVLVRFAHSSADYPYESSVTSKVGRTNVTTLLGPYQIFEKIFSMIQSAKKSILIETFHFQNYKIDGISPRGAERFPAYPIIQQLADILRQKKKQNPKILIQIILDPSDWCVQDKVYRFNNEKITRFFKENGIEILPYPPATEGGPLCFHDKFLAVDGRSAYIGSANFTSHTAASHESGIFLETQPQQTHSEVDNLIKAVFNKNWQYALRRTSQLMGTTYRSKLLYVIRSIFSGKWLEFSNGVKALVHPFENGNSDYQKYLMEIFGDREFSHYSRPPVVHPVRKPEVVILTSNSEHSNRQRHNQIGQYILNRLDTATSVMAEMPHICDNAVVDKIVERLAESKAGGRPFTFKVIMYPDSIQDFGYVKNAYARLLSHGAEIALFNDGKAEDHKLHSRWVIFDERELLFGTPKWEASSLQDNFRGQYWKDIEEESPQLLKGNREFAVVIKNAEIVKTFQRQFAHDYDYSLHSSLTMSHVGIN